MAKSTELTLQESRELLLNPAYQQQRTFEIQQRMAQMYVQSTIVPPTYRGNIGNCVIAIDMAQRMKANPLMVMQNLYIVHGNPAWSSKFLIACINMSGRFTPLRYEFTGNPGGPLYGCRAFAYEKADKERREPLYSAWITMQMATQEGWTSKEGSKWKTMPQQMLIYRAAAFWSRAYAPEISMGFLTKEEAEEVEYEDITPAVQGGTEKTTTAEGKEPPAAEVRAAMKRQKKSPAPAAAEEPHPQPEETEKLKVDKETGELFGESHD